MALDFGQYVVGFVTLDNLFTPHWADSESELPVNHVDICEDYEAFVKGIAEWMLERRQSHRTKLAVNVIRDDGHLVWGGVGLSVHLTEGEVFDCPSHVARLCEAFWTFANKTRTGLKDFLRPFWYGYVLAATTQQRLRFARRLYVHGKEQVFASERMHELQQQYQEALNRHGAEEQQFARNETAGLYDVFEPTLIRPALEDKAYNLQHLIFHGGSKSKFEDPLSQAFKSIGIPPDTLLTNLHVDTYTPLFLSKPELQKRQISVRLFTGVKQKPLWSITPMFPSNAMHGMTPIKSRSRIPVNPDLVERSRPELIKETFQYKVTETRLAAIGPLEYCGIVWVITPQGGSKESILSICRNDPAVPASYQI
ncbi:hypothetical protein EWM64_g5902 [Hericium alpestre]|uniref:Uncharacterized protein n=1 Tax=Hericium alpestre TaxID=135208 RepID=A0A4Y9ZX77_9AGAM|nr:hypothetical protein EWM64_g5902 [Hericium alpestre]